MRLEILQDVGIAVSQERSLAVVLRRIVEGLARAGGIALARLWLFGPDNNCEVCTQGSLQSRGEQLSPPGGQRRTSSSPKVPARRLVPSQWRISQSTAWHSEGRYHWLYRETGTGETH
jgi:hypothetical protein